MHIKQHFPTSDCWTNVKLSKQKLAKVRRNWKNEYNNPAVQCKSIGDMQHMVA